MRVDWKLVWLRRDGRQRTAPKLAEPRARYGGCGYGQDQQQGGSTHSAEKGESSLSQVEVEGDGSAHPQ